MGYRKVAITRAGRLREWSQRELRLLLQNLVESPGNVTL